VERERQRETDDRTTEMKPTHTSRKDREHDSSDQITTKSTNPAIEMNTTHQDQITTKSTNPAIEIQRRANDATTIFARTIPSVQSTKTNED
jgi:hypothetical protein